MKIWSKVKKGNQKSLNHIRINNHKWIKKWSNMGKDKQN